jgi:hypothetical protein
MLGHNRLVVSKVLNHVEGGVTAVYDRHSYDPEKKAALDAWASKLIGLVDYKPQEIQGQKSEFKINMNIFGNPKVN